MSPADLHVGDELHIYGRVIALTDCDPFTRSYYEQAGDEQAPQQPGEEDNFQKNALGDEAVQCHGTPQL